MPSKRKTKSGQSLVEFALVSILFFFMIILTLNAILIFATHQYLSYSTFLTARAFQASALTQDQQLAHACQVLARMLDNADFASSCQPGPNANVKLNLNFELFQKRLATIDTVRMPLKLPANTKVGVSVLTGDSFDTMENNNPHAVIIQYRAPLVQFPIFQELQEFTNIPMVAKSSLGRETTTEECRKWFDTFFVNANARVGNSAPGGQSQYMEDNGC